MGDGQWVHPHIEQAAPGEFWVEQPVLGHHRSGETKRGRHQPHVADTTVINPAAHNVVNRQKPGPHRLHRKHTGIPGRGNNSGCAFQIGSERLLHQHSHPRFETRYGRIDMGRVGRADVHRVELFGIQHLAHRPISRSNALGLGECLGPTAVSTGHRADMGILHNLHCGEKLPGDVAVADHAKPNVVCLGHYRLLEPSEVRG